MKNAILYNGVWFNVIEKEAENGAKMIGIKSHSDGVVVLPYTLTNLGEIDLFGVNYECNPLRPNNFWYTCITGGIENNEDAFHAAKRELLEESGYNQQDHDKWQYLGSLFPSKLIDGDLSCFAVNITDLKKSNKKGDGTKNEEHSKFELISLNKLILKEDGYILSMLMKFFVRNYSEIFRKI